MDKTVFSILYSLLYLNSDIKSWGLLALKEMHNMRVVSFIGGKMRTIAQETAFQIALSNCSKALGRKVSIYVILVKREYMHSST